MRTKGTMIPILRRQFLILMVLAAGVLLPAPVRAQLLGLVPDSYNFGLTQVNQHSGILVFKLVNDTNGSFDILSAPEIVANLETGAIDRNFAIRDHSCFGTLAPFRSCTIDAIFEPLSVGSRRATLLITIKLTGCPQCPAVTLGADLMGTGVLGEEVTQSGSKNAGMVGDPVTTSVGEYHFDKPLFDLGGPLPLQLTLSYASWMRTGKVGGYNDPFGGDWSHNYHFALVQAGSDAVAVQYGPGNLIRFEKSGETWQVVGEEVAYELREDSIGAGYYYLLDPVLERVYTFEKTAGQGVANLIRIEDRNSNALMFTNDQKGRVVQVEDGRGRSLVFTYSTPLQPLGDSRLMEVADQTGRTVQFGYDDPPGGRLITVTDPSGLVTTFAYDGSAADAALISQTLPRGNVPYRQSYQRDASDQGWRVSSQTDAYGNATTLGFNDTTRVTTITDALHNSRLHTHEDKRLLTENRDESGRSMSLGYDPQGRRSAVTDRLGGTTRIEYHPQSGKIGSYTDNEGNTITYAYTGREQTFTNPANAGIVTFAFYDLTRITLPDGSHQDFVYDTKGNVTAYTDGAGGTRTYRYDDRGQTTRITNAIGGAVEYAYNADGTLAWSTDTDIGVTTYTYDAHKRTSSVTRPDGSTTSMTYDLNDRPLTITDELGRTMSYGYDANGNLLTETNPLNQTTTYGYDLMDRLISRMDPLGRADAYGYDALGRLASFTNRNGNSTTYTYDSRGWQTGYRNPAGAMWTITNDDEGVPNSTTTPLGFKTVQRTNELGDITAITDPLNATTSFTYDALGRQTSTTDRMDRTTTFSYDGEGRLVGVTEPVIGTATYLRDALGMLTRVTDLRGKHWDFESSPMGRRVSNTDPLGHRWSYAYDDRGRLSQIAYPDGGTAIYTYDDASQVTQVTYSGDPNLSYAYDAASRLLTANDVVLTRDARGDVTNSRDGEASFGATYDDDQRLGTVTYDGQATVTYTYDTRDLLTRVQDDLAAAWMNFSYDADGRLTRVTRSNGVDTTYTYDDAGRVTRIQDGPIADQQYTLNAEGEPVGAVRSLPLDPVPAAAVVDLTYDDASQISSPGYAYDARGRQVAAPGRTFGYDMADRLTSVSSGSDTVAFSYNGLGELRRRESAGVTTAYYYNYAYALAATVAEQVGGVYERFYVYTPSGGLLYSIDAASGAVRFFHFDRLGSTLFLTDGSGAVADAYAYGSYGTVLGHTGDSDQPFQYLGQFAVRREPVGNLYDMRARYYDPTTTRFLTPDPVWPVLEDSQSLNPYQYASQNPLRHIDPLGLQGPNRQRTRRQQREATVKVVVQYGDKIIDVLSVTGDSADNASEILQKLSSLAAERGWAKLGEKLLNASKTLGKVSIGLQAGVAVLEVSKQTFILATQGAAGHYKAYYDAPGARAVRMITGESGAQVAAQVKRDLNAGWYDPTRWGSDLGRFGYRVYDWITSFFG